jgi:hypothetical protein
LSQKLWRTLSDLPSCKVFRFDAIHIRELLSVSWNSEIARFTYDACVRSMLGCAGVAKLDQGPDCIQMLGYCIFCVSNRKIIRILIASYTFFMIRPRSARTALECLGGRCSWIVDCARRFYCLGGPCSLLSRWCMMPCVFKIAAVFLQIQTRTRVALRVACFRHRSRVQRGSDDANAFAPQV